MPSDAPTLPFRPPSFLSFVDPLGGVVFPPRRGLTPSGICLRGLRPLVVAEIVHVRLPAVVEPRVRQGLETRRCRPSY